jgi:hypothetical protein
MVKIIVDVMNRHVSRIRRRLIILQDRYLGYRKGHFPTMLTTILRRISNEISPDVGGQK